MSSLRDLFATRQAGWSNTLNSWKERYLSIDPGRAIGVAAIALDDKGQISQEIHFGAELQERVEWLQLTNSELNKLQVGN